MRKLEQIIVKNFKSIRRQELKLAQLNVFIGGNGSGKSNLVNVFNFLNRVANGELQTYAGIAGGADNILHFGRKHSPVLGIKLQFASGTDANGYSFELIPTEEDSFIFQEEFISYHDRLRYPSPYNISLGSGHRETMLSKSKEKVATYVRTDLESYRIYHFHDTSPTARVKQTNALDDNRTLRSDASNLAGILVPTSKDSCQPLRQYRRYDPPDRTVL